MNPYNKTKIKTTQRVISEEEFLKAEKREAFLEELEKEEDKSN